MFLLILLSVQQEQIVFLLVLCERTALRLALLESPFTGHMLLVK